MKNDMFDRWRKALTGWREETLEVEAYWTEHDLVAKIEALDGYMSMSTTGCSITLNFKGPDVKSIAKLLQLMAHEGFRRPSYQPGPKEAGENIVLWVVQCDVPWITVDIRLCLIGEDGADPICQWIEYGEPEISTTTKRKRKLVCGGKDVSDELEAELVEEGQSDV